MIKIAEVMIETEQSKLLKAQQKILRNEDYGDTNEYILEYTDVSLAGSFYSAAGEDLMQAGQDVE